MGTATRSLQTRTGESAPTLIVGAGASYGSRVDDRPPLGNELADYLHTWLTQNEQRIAAPPAKQGTLEDFQKFRLGGKEPIEAVRDFLADARKIEKRGFEVAMTKLIRSNQSRCGLLEEINSVLAQSFLEGTGCRFREQEDLYDSLLRDYCGLPTAKLQLISFNYDLLLEEAVARVLGVTGILDAVDYAGLEQSGRLNGGPIRMYKPHGSINWFDAWGFPGSMNNPDRPAGTSSYSIEGHYLGQDSGVALVAPGDRNNISAILTQGESRVLMAQYSSGKPIPSNPSVILAVRAGCVRAMQCAGNNPITLIGLGLPVKDDPDDDPVLADLFNTIRSCRGAKTYVSPNEAECVRAVREYRMTARCVGLDAFLDTHPASECMDGS
jgi:hypothetical protein